MSKKVTRLFEQFQPEHYDLTLDIDRDAMSFSGTVVIKGKKTGRPSERLTFHQKGLKITAATITKHDKKGDQNIEVKRINNQDTYDEVRLHTEGMAYPGEYTVTLEFEGSINEQMHGIYPCFYKHNGIDKKVIVTQFESHHAREAFPCIDEPEAKATFDLRLITPAGESVLGNTPVKKQTTSKDRQTTSFETSPKMSSYLLAFVFGELQCVSAKANDGTIVSSWATVAQQKSHLNYANEEAIKTLEYFIDYFDTPFPLQKLDQVALPDFDSLAMENWGLITFREVGLLADPINRSISSEQLISLVIAHELSHQWFGNLVTMRWWDDLWLNESFASIMENMALDALHPDWVQWEDFMTGRALGASNRDIYKDVQSVSVQVKHPDEISTLFDPAIVYAKGARLLKMLHEYVGDEVFRAGLKNYFKKHAYKNTVRGDLWTEFSAVSGQDIEKLMTPWLIQSGTPLLRVSRTGDKIHLSQNRFLLDGGDDETMWPIPLLSDTSIKPVVFDKKSAYIDYPGDNMPIFNLHGTGHYIVCYEDEKVRKNMHAKVVDRSIESISRVNVLNDMLLLSRAGETPMVEMLELIKQCSDEPRDAVWSMFSRVIGNVQILTEGDEKTEKLVRAFKLNLSKYWYDILGWTDKPDDTPNTKHLRSTVLAFSIAGENQKAINKSLDMYKNAGSVEKLPAEQRALVAGSAVRFGDPKVIKQLMNEYAESQNSELRETIVAALCSTRKPEVAKQVIEWGLAPNTGVVRQQDISHWFAYLMRNYHTRPVIWEWLTKNWGYLSDLFGGGKSMEYFIWYAAGPLSTPEWQSKFTKFFESKLNDPGSTRNIKIAFGEIAARVEWRNREEDSLKAFFKS